MMTDEYGGIAKSSLPAGGMTDEYGGVASRPVTDEYGGVASRPVTDEYGGVAKALQPAPSPVTNGQKFQANPGIQAAADQYVKDKWSEYGQSAGASQGQAIRDYAKSAFGMSTDPSRIPALDYRPEHDPIVQTSYVRDGIANQPGGLDRVQQLEDQWRAEYLRHALPAAVAQQQDAASAPKPEDVGLIHGHVNAILRGAANQVMKPVEGGSELYYALGDNNADDGLHGANPNLTRNQLARNATMSVLHEMDDRINNAYKPSTNAANGGFAKNTEGFAEMLPSLLLAKGMHGPAEGMSAAQKLGVYGQQMLTFGQMGMAAFGDTYQEFYKSGREQGLDDKTASNNALFGGLAAAAVNTYLMKFGAAGNTGPSSVVRSALTATVHDALAQGAVGTAQGMTSEVAKYIATGESAKIENVIEQAKQGAGAGVLFGLTRGIHEGVANRLAGRGVEHTEAGVSSDPLQPDPAKIALALQGTNPARDNFGGVAKGTENGPERPVSGGVPDGGSPAPVSGPSGAGGGADEATPGVGVRPELATPLLDKQTPKLRVNNPDGSSTAKPILFDSTIDKALYAATEQRQGKIGKEATAYLEAHGYDADRIAAEGEMVREKVAAQHDPKADRITVPKDPNGGLVNTAREATPEPAPVHGAPDRLGGVAEPQAAPPAGESGVPRGAVRGQADAGTAGADAGDGGRNGRVAVAEGRGFGESRPHDAESIGPGKMDPAKFDETYGYKPRPPEARLSPDLGATKERQRIGVDESRVEETRYGSAYRDLTFDEIHRLAAVSAENDVRGIHNPETGETVWWGANKAAHHDMASALGWPEPADRNSLEAQIRGDKVWVHRARADKAEAFDAVTQRRNTSEFMQSPAEDGYKTETDRAARKAQMERVKAEMRSDENAAVARVGSKPENRNAIDQMQSGRVPTPDAPTTDKEAKASAKRLAEKYPGVQIHRPANTEQAGLSRLIEQTTGRRVVYVSREGDELPFKGVVFRGDQSVAFVRSDLAGADMAKTAWHEFWHTFQHQHPDLAEEILRLVPKGMAEKAADDYMARAGGPDSEMGKDLARFPDWWADEAGATLFENFSQNPRIMERLTGGQRSALGRFFDWLKSKLGMSKPRTEVERRMRDYLDRVREALKTGETELPDASDEDSDMSQDGVDEYGNDYRSEAAKGRDAASPPDAKFAPLGAEKFGKEVKDKVTDALEGFAKTWDQVKRVFAPARRGPEAEQAAGAMRHRLAEYAQSQDRLNDAFGKAKDAMNKMPTAVTRDFVNKGERGLPQSDPKLQALSDAARTVYDEYLNQVQGLGTGKLADYVVNYFSHSFKNPKKAAAFFQSQLAKRPFEGTKGFLKKRFYQYQSDALAAGLELATENPIEQLLNYSRDAGKYIAAHRVMNELKAAGIVVRVKAREVGAKKAAGYDQINDKIGTIYAKPNRKGGLSIAGYLMAPEPVATLINNHLAPGLGSHPFLGQTFRMVRGIGNTLNQVQLGLSGYHATFATFDAANSKLALALKDLDKGRMTDALKDAGMSASLAGPAAENYLMGRKLQEEWMKPGTHPDLAVFAHAFAASGGRTGKDPFYHNDLYGAAKKAWAQGNVIGAAVRGPLALIEKAASPILDDFVPRMKVGAWLNMARHEWGPDGSALKGKSLTEVRRVGGNAWDSVENRLGEMTYDNLFWHRMAKDLAMVSVRSVGWNLGTLRELGGGTLDTAKAMARVAQGKRPELTHRMAYTIALPMLTAFVGGMTHRLLTGQNPKDLKDYFNPGTGELDKSGHMVRLNVPGYMQDVLKYKKDLGDAYNEGRPALALRTIGNKTHPLINATLEMLNNRDYYGDKIRNEDDPWLKRRVDEAKFLGKQFEPFGIRDMAKLHDEGQGLKSTLPFFGVTRARTDVNRSDAENLAVRLMEEAHPPGSRTTEQEEHRRNVRDLSDGLRAKEPDAVDKIRKAASDGTLNQGDIERIRQDQKTPDLLGRMVKHLEGPDGLKVWDTATPDERRRIGPILMGKVRSSKTMTRDEKVEAIRKIQSGLKGNPAPEAEEGE